MLLDARTPTLLIRSAKTHEHVCESVELANTFLRRVVGLLGRRSLGHKAGLWIVPSSGVHTFGMMFAIDVLMLDRQMRVIRVHENLQPNRVGGICRASHSALEIPAGSIKAQHLAVGDLLVVDSLLGSQPHL